MREIIDTLYENGTILCPTTFIFKALRAQITVHVFVVRPIRYVHVFHWPFVVNKNRHFRRVSGIIFAPYSRKVLYKKKH